MDGTQKKKWDEVGGGGATESESERDETRVTKHND
jgi:hypothetical protein